MPRMQKAKRSEFDEQRAVVMWFRMQFPDYLIYHIPNGGYRNPIEARNLKLSGVLGGIPDLHIPVAKGMFHGMYIEMKAENGRLSTVQSNMLNKLNDLGHFALCAYGFNEARGAIMDYMRLE